MRDQYGISGDVWATENTDVGPHEKRDAMAHRCPRTAAQAGILGSPKCWSTLGSKRVIAAIRRPERVTTIRLVARNPSHGGVAGVEGERRLPVGFGLDDAAAGPGVRRRARRSARRRRDRCTRVGVAACTRPTRDVGERRSAVLHLRCRGEPQPTRGSSPRRFPCRPGSLWPTRARPRVVFSTDEMDVTSHL